MEELSEFMGPEYAVRLNLVDEQAGAPLMKKLRDPESKYEEITKELFQRIANSQSTVVANLLINLGGAVDSREEEKCNYRFSVESEFCTADDVEKDDDGFFIHLSISPNFYFSEDDYDVFSEVLEGKIFKSAGPRALAQEMRSFLKDSEMESAVTDIKVNMSGFGFG